jgi:ABC-type transporter Mla maintaining outer membrane lipid asymmetry ATPase subunit MlaF
MNAVIEVHEPTPGLDAQSARAIQNLVRQLNSEGKTVFLTTHLFFSFSVRRQLGVEDGLARLLALTVFFMEAAPSLTWLQYWDKQPLPARRLTWQPSTV